MDIMVLRIFQREVERQCRFALIAAQDLEQALMPLEQDRLWYSVQALLGSAGNVSKLLWPTPPGLAERGNKLRESLSVEDNSPLESRTFRNHFEHFDERIGEWAASSERRNIVDSNVGPPGGIVGIDPGDYLRNFDTSKFAVTFSGTTYMLGPVIEAIKSLCQRAKTEALKPHYQ